MLSTSRAARCSIWLLIGVACAKPDPVYWIENGHAGAPGVENVLVVPLNITFSMPTDVESQSDLVFAELANYLIAQKREPVTVSVVDANRLWASCILEVGESRPAAVSLLAQRLGESGDYDAIVIPDIVFRNAKLSRRSAEWDGANRSLRIVNKPPRFDDSIVRTMSFGGSTAGVSVRTRVYAPTGDLVFEGYGGIELVYQMNLEDLDRSRRFQIDTRPDLLQDVELIREGVEQSFLPYLEPLNSSER
jgi:hypothetical protein